MFRIRLHGRGGHGIKTAGRILGTALFHEGFEVQDAPVYGAERRGAPIFAYVRAARRAIHERGIIARPDLIVIADESLASVPGVLAGMTAEAVLLINSAEAADTWRQRLNLAGPVLTLALATSSPVSLPAAAGAALPGADPSAIRFIGAACAAAAAALLGVVARPSLEQAIRDELGAMGPQAVTTSLREGLAAYDLMAPHAGCVREGGDDDPRRAASPAWIDLPPESAAISAPDIHATLTSVRTITGAWRTMRPVIEPEHCHRCWWVCSTFCPDGAISVGPGGVPAIDYDHCKGCLVCAAVCPHHAITVVPERQAAAGDGSAS